MNTQNLNSNFDNFDDYSSSISGPTEGSIPSDQLAMEGLYETRNNCEHNECTFPECRCDEDTCCKNISENCGCPEGCMGDWDDDEESPFTDTEIGDKTALLMGMTIITLGVTFGFIIGYIAAKLIPLMFG